MERFSLKGRTALVAGASRGIGADIAKALGEAGANVAVIFRRSRAEADEIVAGARRLGTMAGAYQQDISEVAALPALVERIEKDLGPLDILVNNAAIADLVPLHLVTPELMRKTLDVNVTGPFFLSQAVSRRMVERKAGGRIINITSTNGFVGEALLAPYNASKGAMEMLTKSLAIELGPHGITVNSVAPGLIETEIAMDFPLKKEFWDYAVEHIPLGKLGKPSDCAGAVVFLASEAGQYITGQHIIVDGGLLADQFPRMQFYTGPKM